MDINRLAKLRTRGLGKLSELPLEIRTKIWLAWTYEEHPRRTHSRLKRTSPWIRDECRRILMDDRILSFDLLSYGQGRWPSEFSIHDQFGCSWLVCPQFGGQCCTLEGGNDIKILLGYPLYPFKQMRIRMVAPQDATEALMLWNRMRWIAQFLAQATVWDCIDLHIELHETRSRSWWIPGSAPPRIRSLPPDLAELCPQQDIGLIEDLGLGEKLYIHAHRGNLMTFALSPFAHWCKEATVCLTQPDGTFSESQRSPNSLQPRLLPHERDRLQELSSSCCPRWLNHILDKLCGTRSANMLRLEMLASIDCRGNRPLTFRAYEFLDNDTICRVCVDQRNAASAYAPQHRDKMLQIIKKQKALQLEMYHPTEHQFRSALMEMAKLDQCEKSRLTGVTGPHKDGLPMSEEGLYGEVNEYYRCSKTPWIESDVDCKSFPAINKAFQGHVETTEGRYGWPRELFALEFHWASLRHWRLAHQEGIPDPDSPAHAATMRDFQTRHVHHPYELCSCKGASQPRLYGCFCNDQSVRNYFGMHREVGLEFGIPGEEEDDSDEDVSDEDNSGERHYKVSEVDSEVSDCRD